MTKQVLTKERIILAAITQIENGGPLTFSVLAKQLGSRSQALYTYFANVTELKYAVVAWCLQRGKLQVQDQLFGQAGSAGILAFAQTSRALALQHERLSRFVLAQDRTQNYPDVVAAFDGIKHLLHQLLDGTFQDTTIRELAGRCVRDLIVGDFMNVGAGWFTDKLMTPDESFEQLVRRNLALFQQLDEQRRQPNLDKQEH